MDKAIKMCTWNVAGILNKDNDTWKYLNNFDIVELIETWVDKGRWEKLKGNLPKKFNWKCSYAEKVNKKGRAKGGIITGVSKNIKEVEYKEWSRNIVERKLKINGRIWRMITVYSQDINETLKVIREGIEETKEEILIMGGGLECKNGMRRRTDS